MRTSIYIYELKFNERVLHDKFLWSIEAVKIGKKWQRNAFTTFFSFYPVHREPMRFISFHKKSFVFAYNSLEGKLLAQRDSIKKMLWIS